MMDLKQIPAFKNQTKTIVSIPAVFKSLSGSQHMCNIATIVCTVYEFIMKSFFSKPKKLISLSHKPLPPQPNL